MHRERTGGAVGAALAVIAQRLGKQFTLGGQDFFAHVQFWHGGCQLDDGR